MVDSRDEASATTARRSAVDGFIDADSANISLFPQQVVDNMMHTLIALGAEMWTMRRRMLVMEKVMEKAGVSTTDIELYTPTPAETAAWEEERDIFIQRTFGALTRKGGANDKQLDMSRM